MSWREEDVGRESSQTDQAGDQPCCDHQLWLEADVRWTGDLRFVYIGFRYGGPTLKTPATRMYWKHDKRNSEVFS
jgi:hypothetical protein